MLGVLVNMVAVVLGSTIGLLCKKGIPQKVSTVLMSGVGLCVVYIGIDGALEGSNTVALVLAMALGAFLGAVLDIDGGLNRLGDKVTSVCRARGGQFSNVGEGFVSGTLLFCVGAMMVVGSLEAGLTGDNTTLYIKSLLDFISSMVLSVTLGAGVMLSALAVGVLQGSVVLLSGVLQPLLSDMAIAEMTCAGSVIIFGLGCNMLGFGKIKVANLLPAIILAPLFAVLCSWI